MVLITKTAAENIYKIWCSSEDTKFEYKNEIFDLEYNDEGDVCYLDADDDWVKITALYEQDVDVSVADWVFTSDNSWKV